MKFFRMSDRIPLEAWDGKERPVLFLRSPDLMQTKTGNRFVDYSSDEGGEPFEGALLCDLDDEEQTGVLPTLFTSPALIATRAFRDDLLAIGVDNLEVHPAILRDLANDRVIEDYVVLNVLGRVPHAALNQAQLGHGPVGLEMFLLDEDADCVLVSERVFRHLHGKGYPDILFEPFPLA